MNAGLRPTDRYLIATTAAMMLIGCALLPLTEDHSYLAISWCLIVAMGGTSMLVRRTRLGAPGVAATHLILIGLLTAAVAGAGGPSGMSMLHRVVALYHDAAAVIRTSRAPMPASAGLTMVFVGCLGGITLILDQLVVTLRKPALSLVPLLGVFAVPALTLGTGAGAGAFLCVAVGYLGILAAEGLNTVTDWVRTAPTGRAQSGESTASRRDAVSTSQDSAMMTGMTATMVWRGVLYLGVPAIALALIAAVSVPTFVLNSPWEGGGGGQGHGPVKLTDPTLNLRRNLTRPDDQEVLHYRTNKSSGVYLRMASLPKVSSRGWRNGKSKIDRGQKLPMPPGLSSTSRKKRRTKIHIENLDSQYLPVPYAPRRFTAPGKWGYDPQSLVVLSSKKRGAAETATRDADYSVVSRDVKPSSGDLSSAGPGKPPDAKQTTKVPHDLPSRIVKLTKRVTRHASTAAGKADAIQEYLRDSGKFTYDLHRRPGSGYTAVQNFLFKDQAGYCEQFAGTMALMARISGIPTRVAIGFLPGSKDGKDWVVTSNNMHAWPELYFRGYGWIRYEPTPAEVTGEAPDWTVHTAHDQDDEEADTPSGSADHQSASAHPSAPDRGRQPETADTSRPETTSSKPPTGRIAGTGAGIVGLLGLTAAPGLLRTGRRRRRLRGGFTDPGDRVEAGWSEIRDTTRDLGYDWPAGSPRAVAAAAQDWLSPRDDGATDALNRLAILVERARYARRFGAETTPAEVTQLVTRVRRGLTDNRTVRSRLRAVVLPRSIWRRSR